jgi:hypothetical protein
MAKIHGFLAIAACLLAGAPAGAADTAPDQCAAMNYLLAQARTEFPELARTKLNAGRCTMAGRQFKCEWGFPGDRFDAAKQQASVLIGCTAANKGATPLEGRRGEARFQLNPETSVSISGPQMDSGDWKLTLRISSTADWK